MLAVEQHRKDMMNQETISRNIDGYIPVPGEADSALASALLKIQRGSQRNAIQQASASELLGRAVSGIRRQAIAEATADSPRDNLFAADPAVLQQLRQRLQGRPPTTLSPLQMAAIRATGASTGSVPVADPATSPGSITDCFFGRTTVQPKSPRLPLTAASLLQSRVLVNSIDPSSRFPSENVALTPGPQDNSVASRLFDSAGLVGASRVAPPIRKEQVEAALRSKPQRGRKRDNLNEMERLELTRHRNREHAKTTRIRKKARYEELVENEQKLIEYQKREDSDERRRDSIRDFLSIREGMIRASSDGNHERGKDRSDGNRAYSTQLEEVIANVDSFSYEDSLEDVKEREAFIRMRKFDEIVALKVASSFGQSSIQRLGYKIKGSNAGVALGLNGRGFAEVDLCLPEEDGCEDIHLMTGLLSFLFLESSDRLLSVRFTLLRNSLGLKSTEK